MSALQFPCTLFKSQNRMDDNSASDMRCGDLTELQLKMQFHLVDVSSRVDPWTLTKITPFLQPHSMFHGSRGQGEKVTRQRCATILFDELRHLSRGFSFYGPYSHLIKEMIDHMQYGDGKPFSHASLNSALKRQIVDDRTDNSTLLAIKKELAENINWQRGIFPAQKNLGLIAAIYGNKLPKFDRIKDNFNGMGITVHDTWATSIILKSLHIEYDSYRARIHCRVQDHFGLDENDILNVKFNAFRFFRIWYVLQHYSQFGFKPFMTNMEATINVTGYKDEKIK